MTCQTTYRYKSHLNSVKIDSPSSEFFFQSFASFPNGYHSSVTTYEAISTNSWTEKFCGVKAKFRVVEKMGTFKVEDVAQRRWKEVYRLTWCLWWWTCDSIDQRSKPQMTSGKDKSTPTKNAKFWRAQAREFQESRSSDFLKLKLQFSEPKAAREVG